MGDIKIDKEYASTWWDETKYLIDHGVRYVFVKEENGITIWKFKKTQKLFQTLADFYARVYSK